MTREKTSEDTVCALCGRRFPAEELVWNSGRAEMTCRDCLREEESCGCEDE